MTAVQKIPGYCVVHTSKVETNAIPIAAFAQIALIAYQPTPTASQPVFSRIYIMRSIRPASRFPSRPSRSYVRSSPFDSLPNLRFKISGEQLVIQSMNLKLAETLVTLQNSKPSQIPPFADEQLFHAKNEVKRLVEQIRRETERTRSLPADTSAEMRAFQKSKLALLFDQVYRVKRFMLVYFNFRCDRIEEQFWNYGGKLNKNEVGHLSEHEKKYFSDYKTLVMEYVEEVGVEMTIDLDPPLEVEVEVRMLEDCEDLIDDDGNTVKLEKNSCFIVKKRLIEPYVRQGQAVIKRQ